MLEEHKIEVTQTQKSRLKEVDFENIRFGEVCADHMFLADYRDGRWHKPQIMPYGKLPMAPTISALHYGQSIFEGMKAYKTADGQPVLFRPEVNATRFNESAKRMAMPTVPEGLFISALSKLISIDQDWIPTAAGASLYVRPFMFATEEYVGIKVAENFRFIIFTSPVSTYYSKPVRILAADYYIRAFRGGTGRAKAAGNYGASMLPMMEARAKGYDQVLWLDGGNYNVIQESGTMNIFFVIDGTAVTPSLENDDILEGVTRDSVISLLRENGRSVEERTITMEEIAHAHSEGRLQEAFGTGTAATIAPVSHIGYQGQDLELNHGEGTVASWLKQTLSDLKRGMRDDPNNWVFPVNRLV